MIEISHLVKRHRARTVVDDVSFTARPGRVTGFLGPNGAGKSSTLRILLGLDRATSGTALVDGVPYRSLDRPLWTVGAMLDGPGANPGRTARSHLTWVAQSNAIPRRRVDEVLDLVGLRDAARTRIGRFSLGMGQRLGIAAALLGDPEVLVLDEPTNGLDPEGIRWIRLFLRTLADEGRTVLVSSHLMAEMEKTADDVVIIAGGRVVAAGSAAEVRGEHDSVEEAFFALTDERHGRPAGGSEGIAP
ncbi:ABC transporter ATP-binding protein [Labedella endophytica]|uniref:ATP-binding cassette domain-containing protein n=1 Tax=Labedella endophytica TaxID=1523160 RepID=A0A433JT14_9MICO|nr:ATP-binding cassette domain-containing protein [Labedella endophytica]RUR01542.1 ATP-binding cassette domain-containing protein [Labedella endophytica]